MNVNYFLFIFLWFFGTLAIQKKSFFLPIKICLTETKSQNILFWQLSSTMSIAIELSESFNNEHQEDFVAPNLIHIDPSSSFEEDMGSLTLSEEEDSFPSHIIPLLIWGFNVAVSELWGLF